MGFGGVGLEFTGSGLLQDEVQKNTSTESSIKVIGLFAILVGAGVTVGLLLYLRSNSAILCSYYSKDSNSNVFSRQMCETSNCPFDVSACSQKCPFSYDSGEEGCPRSCTCAAEAKKYQGDVVFDSEQVPEMLQERGMLDDQVEGFSVRAFAITAEGLNVNDLWNQYPKKNRYEIPYAFPSNEEYDPKYKELIESLLNRFSTYVCLDFIKKTTEKDYIQFINHESYGCSSQIGRRPQGRTIYLFYPECTAHDVAYHEIMHTLGFHHEINRHDRDEYVKVHFENVKENWENIFLKLDESLGRYLTEFDYNSIMLHDGYALSKEPGVRGKESITRIDTGLATNDNIYMSDRDAEGIRRLYGCTGTFSSLRRTQEDAPQLQQAPTKADQGEWGDWSKWTSCSKCSSGTTTKRERKCHAASIKYCEKASPFENAVETMNCTDTDQCIKRPRWNDWAPWNLCFEERYTYEGPKEKRYRFCIGPETQGDVEEICEGKNVQQRDCTPDAAGDVKPKASNSDPHWLAWDAWTNCEGYCNKNRVDYRQRKCSAGSANRCTSPTNIRSYEEVRCYTRPHCKGAYQWASVSADWSQCSVSCGEGIMTKDRRCNGPSCEGESKLTAPCIKKSCTTEEKEKIIIWKKWTVWTGCDNSCDSPGSATRTRSCDGGSVEECEAFYKDVSSQTRECELLPCTHAQWNEWQEWAKCSKTCGVGWRIRERTCSEENKCDGLGLGFERCSTEECAPIPEWSQWSLILPCHRTCGLAIRIYRRTCNPPPLQCDGRAYNVLVCKVDPCPAALEEDGMLDDEAAFSVFSISKFTSVGDLCNRGSPDSWVFGDFNGDKISDAACGKDSGNFTFALSGSSQFIESVAWQGEMQDCKGEIKLSADFNGDGSDDLLCQDKKGSLLSVKLSNNGNFNAQATYSSKFCTEENDVVIFADANNDKKIDIVCHHEDSGEVELFIM